MQRQIATMLTAERALFGSPWIQSVDASDG